MVNFAAEMQRQGLTIPLLIGGATTSRAHTAVKVDPKYDGPVVWVKDASRSVPTAAALLHETGRAKLMADVKADYDSLRARHAAKNDRPMVTLEQARANATPIDWTGYHAARSARPAAPSGQRVRVLRDYDLAGAARLHRLAAVLQRLGDEGRLPRHPQQPELGPSRAQALRRRAGDARPDDRGEVAPRPRRRRLLPGQRRSATTSRSTSTTTAAEVHATLHHLRQQGEHRDGVPNRSLADFVAPKETGLADHVGAFAVTAGIGVTERVEAFQRRPRRLQRDPARVAGRPARRGVRRAPARAGAQGVLGLRARRAARQRRASSRSSTTASGRRPATRRAPSTPRSRPSGSCSTSRSTPASSSPSRWRCGPAPRCAGCYFSHPQSQYFVVGRLGRDQVADYAERKGWTLAEAERWLSPNLGYDPED